MNGIVDSRSGGFRAQVVTRSDVRSPVLIEAHDIWTRLRGMRDMPARRDFDPTGVPPHLLPHLMLVDVVHEPVLRFRWRLLGTHVTTAMGRNSSGRWFDELYDGREQALVDRGIRGAIETRQPCFTRAQAPSEERSFLLFEAVDMPLSSDGKRVDMILGACQFHGASMTVPEP